MAPGTLARLLSALSAECDELAMRVDDMHRFLSDDGQAARARTSEFVTAAQDIDFVQQHLAALAEFLMLVSESTPGGIAMNLEGPLRSIRLSDLRDRLAGEQSPDESSRVEAGELELL